MPKLTGKATKLTKTLVDNTPCPKTGQVIVRDSELRGFALLVSAGGTKSFFIQHDLNRGGQRVSVRKSVGRYGLITTDEARKRARSMLAALADGIDPRRPVASGLTLGQAWEGFAKAPRSARTQRRYALIMRLYVAPWLLRPLSSITGQDVRVLHAQLACEIAAGKYAQKDIKHRSPKYNGECSANDAMRLLRVIWNDARRAYPELPANPCDALHGRWFKTEKPRTVVAADQVAAWYEGTAQIQNPTRRDFLRLVLFSGLRRQSAAEIRWGDVDLERATLRIPRPKGGTEKAFTLPLSDYLVTLLKERRAGNAALAEKGWLPPESPWVFPAWGESGHLTEAREDVGVAYTPHALRRTYATVAEGLDLSPYAIKTLLNHEQPKSVTGGYINLTVERLRAAQQRITDELLRLVSADGPANVVPMRRSSGGQ